MGLKVALAILTQVFILMPTFAREPPPRSWTYQEITDNTKRSKFGTHIALNDLTGFLTDDIFDKVPECYGRVKEDYRKTTKDFTENMKATFSEIKKTYGTRFKAILTDAEPSFNYITQTMSEYTNKLEKHIENKDSSELQSLISVAVFGMNQNDFDFDISMQKLMQRDHGAKQYDDKILKAKEEAEKKSKKIMQDLEDCFYSYLDNLT